MSALPAFFKMEGEEQNEEQEEASKEELGLVKTQKGKEREGAVMEGEKETVEEGMGETEVVEEKQKLKEEDEEEGKGEVVGEDQKGKANE
jgi:hypothetical protein